MSHADGQPYCVVFDCESDAGFAEGAHSAAERDSYIRTQLQFTVVCALKLLSGMIASGETTDAIIGASTRLTYWRDQANPGESPVSGLLKLFDGAEVIVGYNCQQFDFPLLSRFYPWNAERARASPEQRYASHRCKCLDVMLRLRDVTGRFHKLDNVLKANKLAVKSGDGAQAVRLWEEQRRDELRDYCATDVEVTARLALADQLVGVCGNPGVRIPHAAYGIRAALAAQRACGVS